LCAFSASTHNPISGTVRSELSVLAGTNRRSPSTRCKVWTIPR
jgi:hypothetical protein